MVGAGFVVRILISEVFKPLLNRHIWLERRPTEVYLDMGDCDKCSGYHGDQETKIGGKGRLMEFCDDCFFPFLLFFIIFMI